MKTLQHLNQKFQQWGKKCQNALSQSRLVAKKSPSRKRSPLDCCETLLETKSLKTVHPPFMLGFTVLSLTSLVGFRFYNQPQLAVGTRSPVTIVAPSEGYFEDEKTTAERRKAVESGVIPILMRDHAVTLDLEIAIASILEQVEQLREVAGEFPFVKGEILSLNSQRYIRSSAESDWQAIIGKVAPDLTRNGSNAQRNSFSPNSEQKRVISELKAYRDRLSNNSNARLSDTTFKQLLTDISQARQQYSQARASIPDQKIPYLNQSAITTLLNLTEAQWQTTQQSINEKLHQILIQGIPPGFPETLLQETLHSHFSGEIPSIAQPVATNLLFTVLQTKHNLIADSEATQASAQKAMQAVQPVIIEVSKGDVIVREGEKITQETFVVLDGFGLSQRRVNWVGLVGSGTLVTGAVILFCVVARRIHRPLRRRDHILLCLLSLSTPLLAIFNLGYTNLPMVGLLTSSFYGPTLAITQVTLLSGLSAFTTEKLRWDYLIAGTASGLLAAVMAGRLRSRDELARLGLGVGLVQGGIYLVASLIVSATAGSIWYVVLPKALLYGASGMVWSILALGLSPYLERLFDLVTPIRLVELSNPNGELLKRLATEAPGTFQHTLFVACLAEAAARELHCNVELVRAGTLYHDIGKMHDPLGFIENQMGGPNKHDEIDDPWMSVEIIRKHVTEGIVMAKQYGLPRLIRDFIPEHQGTLLVSYFYYQAKEQAEAEGKEPVNEADFRYDGPTPRSRETGIVMLADGCEAALRSLRDTTPEEASKLIKKIFKARWRDNQLQASGIKYEELPIIADVFVRVWQQFHHRRIAYPKNALEPQSTAK